MSSKRCNKCEYYDAIYSVCIRPELNGYAEKIKITSEGNFVPTCVSPPPPSDSSSKAKKCPSNNTSSASPKNKYSARAIVVNGERFDSTLEYERFCELKLLERCGEISDLQHHSRYVLIDKSKYGGEIAYEPDFEYNTKDGKHVVEDCKSEPTKTRLYKLKKRMMLERYGIEIFEYEKPKKKASGR